MQPPCHDDILKVDYWDSVVQTLLGSYHFNHAKSSAVQPCDVIWVEEGISLRNYMEGSIGLINMSRM